MSLLGQGRMPLRTTWTRAINDLYKPIIPEATDVVSAAIKDYVLGRQTEMDLRHWDGERWVYPTFFQKLVDRVDDRWPNVVKPDTLSDAVNEMATNRPWVTPPVGGNLTGGQALVATGNGLEVEEKLVQFQDPLMVRYVGTQPGDYATFAEAVASLPKFENDLSSSSALTNRMYVIYLRDTATFDSGLVIEGINGISIIGLSSFPGRMISLHNNNNPTNATFGLRYTPNTVSGGSETTGRLLFNNVQLIMNNVGTRVIPDNSDTEYNLLELSSTVKNAYLDFNESYVYASVVAAHTFSTPKTIRGIYFTGTMEAGYMGIYGDVKFHYQRSINHGTYGADICTYIFCESGTPLLIIRSMYHGLPEYGLKTKSGKLSLTNLSGPNWNKVTMLRIKDSTSSIVYAKIFDNIQCYSELAYTAGVINNTAVSFIEFSNVQPDILHFTNITVSISSTSIGNIIDLSNVSVFSTLESANKSIYASFDNVLVKLPSRVNLTGSPSLLKCIDGEVRIANSSLAGFKVVVLGNAKVFDSSSPAHDLLTSNNIRRDESQLFATASRTNGKQFIAQQALPPVAPQPGDLWIETTEQY